MVFQGLYQRIRQAKIGTRNRLDQIVKKIEDWKQNLHLGTDFDGKIQFCLA